VRSKPIEESILEPNRETWGGARFLLLAVIVAAGCGPETARPVPAPGEAIAPPAGVGAVGTDQFARRREEMVLGLEAVVKDRRVLDAMRIVPRHEFIPEPLRSRSYVNTPLGIQENQTISSPEIVALMTEALALTGSEKVLEIGTGSGYQAAVLGELVPEVYSVEIRPTLVQTARSTLDRLRSAGILHFKKLEVIEGNGWNGHKAQEPYDCIIVTAAPRTVPTELINQLKPGGRMVIPVGDFHQELQLIMKDAEGKFTTRNILPVRFVPMVGGER